MALPFVLGLAVGAGAVITYSNNKKIQEKTSEVFEKSKDILTSVKKNVDDTVDCIKNKVDKQEKEEPKKTTRRKRTVKKDTKAKEENIEE